MASSDPIFDLHTVHQSNQAQQPKYIGLLEEIKLKTKALQFRNTNNSKNAQEKQTLEASNGLTYCEKYASVLFDKYNKEPSQNAHKHSLYNSRTDQSGNHSINSRSVYLGLTDQQILRKINIFKSHVDQRNFDSEMVIEQRREKLKLLRLRFEPKISSICHRSDQKFRQLLSLELFLKKIVKKHHKQYITPFNVFMQSTSNHVTPVKKQNHKKQIFKKSSLHHQRGFHIPEKQQSFKKQNMAQSQIGSPNSPNLLSGYNSSVNQSNLLMSFKKNMEASDMGFQTLKYSESDYGTSKKQGNESHEKREKADQVYELPYSPVKPYRIQTQPYSGAQLGECHQKYQTKNLTLEQFPQNDLQNLPDIFNLQTDNANLDKNILQLGHRSKEFLSNIREFSTKTKTQFSQATLSFNSVMEKVQEEMQIQKEESNEEWDQILQLLGEDLSNLQQEMLAEKQASQRNTEHFLQRIETSQNDLIESLFAEKQERKAHQEVLAKTLNQLVANMQDVI